MSETDFFTAHKFKAISEQLFQSLEASEIYFASPESLNDPFDCQIDLVKARRLALQYKGTTPSPLEEARWRALSNSLNAKMRTCGVFSLCGGQVTGGNSSLLWPHYGKNHSGVCLTYRIPDTFVLENAIGVDQVKYTSTGLFDAITSLKVEPIPTLEEMGPLIIALLTTKSSVWAYEEEIRLVAFEPGAKAIPREWLIQICFGLRVGAEDRQRLMSSVQGWGYSECTFAEAYISDDALFDLAIREVNAANP